MEIASKFIEEINSTLSANLTEIIFDGKIKRPKDQKGSDHIWYTAHLWDYKGKSYATVKAGSWSTGAELTLKSWDEKTENKAFKKDYSEKMAEAQAKYEREKQEGHKQCKQKWQKIWNSTPKTDPSNIHPYLEYKGIDDNSSSKIFHDILIIPVYNARNGFVGVQQIYLDPATNKFEKRFSSKIEIRGGFCPLKPFKDEKFAILTEGFATGKSIQKAFPDIPVIVVFSAGNIIPAIEHIRHINPKLKLLIAGDYDKPDKKGRRAGQFYSAKASKQFPNTIYRIPKFSVPNSDWSDFNDLHQFESLDKVREQLTFDPSEFTEIKCLGYKEDNYFYTSSENTQIISLSSSSHSNKMNLISMVGLSYWMKNYGVKDNEDNIVRVDWTKAGSDMMENCRNVGFFDPENLRGRGVWIDENRIVVNTGEAVFVDGVLDSSFKTKYHYIRTKPIEYNITEPMQDDEMLKLLSVFASLKYKNKNDFIYLASWLIEASIFGTLPWRFHVWLSGEAGAGKSTILSWFNRLLIKCSPNLNSSSAGIRQDIQSDTIPVLYDESEPDGFRLKEVIEMARQSSTNSDFDTKRGTTSGKALVYNTQALFMMGSIQKGIEKEADLSRFFIVELLKEKQSLDEYDEMVKRIDYFVKKKESLFSRCVLSAKSVNRSFIVAQKVLREMKLEARQADQIASMLSCLHVYASMEPMDQDDVNHYLSQFQILKSDYIEQNKIKIHENCFDRIMQIKADNQGHTVFHCVENLKDTKKTDDIDKTDAFEQMLGFFGIRYLPSKNMLFIANNSENIKKAIPEFRDYTSILKRDADHFHDIGMMRICNYGNQTRGILVKIKD